MKHIFFSLFLLATFAYGSGSSGAGGVGNSWSDSVDSSIVPDTDDTYNVGSSANSFDEGHFKGDVYAGTITVGGNTTGDSNLGTISSVSLSDYYVGTAATTFVGAFGSGEAKNISYVKIGNVVHLSIPNTSATCSNAATISNSGTELPTGLRPANSVRVPFIVFDNSGSNQIAMSQIDSDGLITIFPTVAGGTFTASGLCGWDRFLEVSYVSN